jgi:carboxyl-terminal processing protease
MMKFRKQLALLSTLVISIIIAVQLAAKFDDSQRPFQFLALYARVMNLTTEHYVDPVDKAALEQRAVSGLLTGLDGESGLIEAGWHPEQRHPAGLLFKSSGSYAVVQAVQPGSPAEKAGFVAGDVLRRVDGQSVYGMGLPKIRAMVESAAASGKKLELLKSRDEEKKALILAGTADRWGGVKLTPDAADGPARLELFNTEGADADAALTALAQFRKDHPGRKVLLDLRRNPGDDYAGAARLAQSLGGKPFTLAGNVRSPFGAAQEFSPAGASARVDAVLVDSSTVRAAEALAASLKESGVAVYGRPTAGLATEQSRIKLSDGRLVWLTTRVAKLAGKPLAPDGLAPTVAADADQEDLTRFALDQMAAPPVSSAKPAGKSPSQN